MQIGVNYKSMNNKSYEVTKVHFVITRIKPVHFPNNYSIIRLQT